MAAPWPSGRSTPPLSPRKRRRFLLDSEESEGEMSLEQYMHSCDIYRSVSVTSPLPLPVKMETVPAMEQKISPLYPAILAIMRRHNLDVNSSFQCGKMSKPKYPGGDVLSNFFSVCLDNSDPNIPPLGPVKDQIVKLFRQHKVNSHVEVISGRLCHRPSVYFIASTHPLVIAYERTKRNIVELLNKTIGNEWRLLCPFNVGSTRAKAEPMIVVLVEPWTRANWFELRTQIKYQLAPHMSTDDFDIEFLPGGLSFLTNRGQSFVDRLTPNAIPRMGYSIGIRGDNNASTLGGFVTLTHDGTVRRGILTNYHGVRPSESSRNNAQLLKDFDRYGSSPARPLHHVIRMESLARIDRDITLAHLESTLNAFREGKSAVTAKVQEGELTGATPNPRLLECIANYDSQMEGILPQRAAVERMPHVLGEVKFVSGKLFRDNQVLDWAFIELSKEAERQCFGPNRMFTIPPAVLPQLLIPPPPLMEIQEHNVLEEFGTLRAGDYCVKNGRTTGVTAGICNGPRAYCNWKSSSSRYDPDGNPVDMTTAATEEFIIVGVESERVYCQRAFCLDGDSGSFILNRHGAVTGLLWGGILYQEDLHVGLVSSMSDVLESIEEKIGGPISVELPQ
ncbi:hypothetical protein N7497_000827 [Penicillium chrysogenum]|jgi:hypothetical protein|uniref:Uncharacterized protein n=1 Tax=Penicillium chrysogenum TaxID=5076 RepID=A0ABQ8WYS7_PENCH|nr:hypothetical protein N7524_009425 [Penicillium chrysogenum]KAJ5283897.1 hypothetical protein N7505_001877 [Penicillium chrysogenum]KAJ6167984.1 hypothetical protein N7497_000827 [Penicillium chrysogenum]